MSVFPNVNGTDDICTFLNITDTGTPAIRANLSDKLGAVLDANASLLEGILINPLMRQYQLAMCNQQFELIGQAQYVPMPGALSMIWSQVVVSGILALISVCFNISLIMVTFRQIKDHKVCNWLLAFDALCQVFTMSTFLTNFFAILFGFNAIDFRLCMVTLVVSVMGMHSSVLSIYLISLERMLLTLAPMRMSLWQTSATVCRWSLIAVWVGMAFGLYMSCSLLLYINGLIQFNTAPNGVLYCTVGVYINAISSSNAYVLLLLALLDYAAIFVFILWRYFTGASSSESVRRVLRALVILSLMVLVGWLVSMCFNPIIMRSFQALLWLFHSFGTDSMKSHNLFFGIYETIQALLHWVGIVVSAGGAPILYCNSTEYRNAYKKMFARNNTTTKVSPLFVQRRHENGVATPAAPNTTAAT